MIGHSSPLLWFLTGTQIPVAIAATANVMLAIIDAICQADLNGAACGPTTGIVRECSYT